MRTKSAAIAMIGAALIVQSVAAAAGEIPGVVKSS